ncbi:hypothetical protein [Paracoccus sp. Ld10]|uniref:hypothetical protein n=1 Tax=Paracoccus sp. Ld10 TaxID=649158 RepID=UPI00386AD826
MLVGAKKDSVDLMTSKSAYAIVGRVCAMMRRGQARNFSVVREALGHDDALFGFKRAYNAAALALCLKTAGCWPGNQARGLIKHQSTIFLFDSDAVCVAAIAGRNFLIALRRAAASAVSTRHLAPQGRASLA